MKSPICNFRIKRTQAQTGHISSYLPIYNIILTLGIMYADQSCIHVNWTCTCCFSIKT